MQGDLLLDIIIFASSDSVNCEYQTYSGANETTSVTTLPLQAPVITSYVELIEELDIYFDEVQGALGYQISTDDGSTWENFTADYCGFELGFEEETGRYGAGTPCEGDKTGLAGNQAMEVKLRACADTACTDSLAGPASNATTMKTRLGDITGLSCTPEITGFSCNWDALTLAAGLVKYKLTYDGSEICVDNGTTTVNKTQLVGDHNFTITVLASASSTCSSDTYSGDASTTYVTSIELQKPSISQSENGTQDLVVDFQKVDGAEGYQVSKDDGSTWEGFTSTQIGETNVRGVQTNVSGNVNYYVRARACADTNCTDNIAGPASDMHVYVLKLGNITGLSCVTEPLGFTCSWDELTYAEGVEKYGLIYGEELECVENGTTSKTLNGLPPLTEYAIEVFAAADEDCDINHEYAGYPSETSVTTDVLPAPQNVEGISGEVETLSVTFDTVDQAVSYAISHDNGNSWENFTSLNNYTTYWRGDEDGFDGNVGYSVKVRACADTNCSDEMMGNISSSVQIEPRLGNITGLACTAFHAGFNCSWDAIVLDAGLNGYAVEYNYAGGQDLCNEKEKTDFSVEGIPGGVEYTITVNASADIECNENEFSGYSSQTQVFVPGIEAPEILNYIIGDFGSGQITINFTRVDGAQGYLITLDGVTWEYFTHLFNSTTYSWGIKNNVPGNVDLSVQVRGCTTADCNVTLAGPPSTVVPLKIALGSLTGFSCSSLISGFNCSWNQEAETEGLFGYLFSYNETSLCLLPNQTVVTVRELPGSALYLISVSAASNAGCVYNEYSSPKAMRLLVTTPLSIPMFWNYYSGVESFTFLFSNIPENHGYLMTLDGGENWEQFTPWWEDTHLEYSVTGLIGNQEYDLAIRACANDSCSMSIIGPSSSAVSFRPSLGIVPSLSCQALEGGFSCTWQTIAHAKNVYKYTFIYGTTRVCLANGSTSHSVTNLPGSAFYNIYVSASATTDCTSSAFSGPNTTTSVTTLFSSPANISVQIGVQTLIVTFNSVLGAHDYALTLDGGSTWMVFDSFQNSNGITTATITGLAGNLLYSAQIAACGDAACSVALLGPSSSSFSARLQLGSVTDLSCSASSTSSLSCSWTPPSLGAGVAGYLVQLNSSLSSKCLSPSVTATVFDNLSPASLYLVSVQASATASCSSSSYSSQYTSFSIHTSPNETSSSSSSTRDKILIASVVVTILVAIILIIIAVFRHQHKKSHSHDKGDDLEMK
eukprot:Anaeramoba_ignava/c21874_g2_i1.p1 GENE.c21874_g2_i1~~c21874_g2_i1.p1  ORF type:complete len:1377 (-),score=262.12 c21874_g2_i1:108-3782(-)